MLVLHNTPLMQTTNGRLIKFIAFEAVYTLKEFISVNYVFKLRNIDMHFNHHLFFDLHICYVNKSRHE